MNENIKCLTPEQAAKMLNTTTNTLRAWSRKGKIKFFRTGGNHRRYDISNLVNQETNKEEEDKRKRICYCRVSTHSQKKDLERQIEFFKHEYPNHEIISDLGSGINFKRKGFQSLVDDAIKGNIREVVVSHKDRLCRFGFELVESIIRKHSDGEIVVLNRKETSPQEELIDDLVSIITVFSSRLYGLRSGKIKSQIQALKNNKNKDVPNGEREGGIKSDDDTVPVVL